jgi:PIN domain nuclease of toxin-antitoxin system
MPFVLDASLILANLNQERGGDRLSDYLDDSPISLVTYVEVVTKLMDGGATFEAAGQSI